MFGKHHLVENLFAYKVRPTANKLPGKFETGTQNHEGIAGVLGTMEYFEWVAKEFGKEYAEDLQGEGYSGRLELKNGLTAIRPMNSS